MIRSGEDFRFEMHRRRLVARRSLADLAALTHYSKGHLSKVENGRKAATSDLARMVDAALEARGALVALVPPRPRRPRLAPVETVEDEEVWIMGIDDENRFTLWSTSRRDLLAAGPAARCRVSAPARVAGTAGRMVPEMFTSWLAQVRALGQRVGPGVVLPVVTGQYHALAGLAAASTGADRTELLILTSRYAEYAGWMAQESGDNATALRWTTRAVALATEAGDRAMASYALVRQALMSLYDGDHAQTVALARRAADDRSAPSRVRGLAAQREAQGHALAGDRYAFERAMDLAEGLLSEADTSGRPPLGTSSLVRPAVAATGWSLYDLGRPQECAATLEDVITRIPAEARRAYARYAARCALAHAATRDIDRACELVGTLLPTIADLSSATIARDLRRLDRRLGQWPRHPGVRELMPALTAAVAAG